MKLVTPPAPLSIQTLAMLPSGQVQKPNRDVTNTRIRIAHIGGSSRFFHSFLASYIEDLADRDPEGGWGISAISIRKPARPEDLEAAKILRQEQARQDHLFTLMERSRGIVKSRVIGAVRENIAAYEDANLVMSRLVSPDVSVISLTITPGSYNKNVDDNIDSPTTWVGYVLKALLERRKQGTPLPTILSCDNAEGNGDLAKSCLISLARKVSPENCSWLEAELKCPNTMVDRITPETKLEDIGYISDKHGYYDTAPVVCEPFRQFVIDQDVGPDFPPLHKVGAIMTDCVRDFERSKLWGLNGSHRAIAYIGYLIGTQLVHDAFSSCNQCHQVPALGRFMAAFMDEMAGAMPTIPGTSPDRKEDYLSSLVKRFSDPSIRDEVVRIGKDGSIKIPGRLMDPIRVQLMQGGEINALAFAVACWIKFVSGVNDDNILFNINDNNAQNNGLQAASLKIKSHYDDTKSETGRGEVVLDPILANDGVFGKDLPENPKFVSAVTDALKDIYDLGTVAALQKRVPLPKADARENIAFSVKGVPLDIRALYAAQALQRTA